MQSSSLLLGRLWEFDNDVAHHGRTNTYTFMHKDKKITLVPLSPADIRKHFKELEKIKKIHLLQMNLLMLNLMELN